MWNVLVKWIGIASVLATVLGVESAMANWGGREIRTVVHDLRAGPAPYHPVYAAVQNTVVTIEDFYLRTADGQVIKVTTNFMTVDLQDLIKFGRGLLIDTRKAVFPPGVTELDVVEIETKISNVHPAYYNSADGTQCHLMVPRFLNFYTSPATPEGFKMGKDEYLVKVDFSALNSIQIDWISRITQQEECDSGDCFSDFWGGRNSRVPCRPVGHPHTKIVKQCELANRRQPINRIVRKVDEF